MIAIRANDLASRRCRRLAPITSLRAHGGASRPWRGRRFAPRTAENLFCFIAHRRPCQKILISTKRKTYFSMFSLVLFLCQNKNSLFYLQNLFCQKIANASEVTFSKHAHGVSGMVENLIKNTNQSDGNTFASRLK